MPLLGKGINLASGALVGTNKALDTKYGPYTNLSEALSEVSSAYRYKGLSIGVLNSLGAVREYWFRDGVADTDLVEKSPQSPSFSYDPVSALVSVTLDNHGLSANSVLKITGAEPSVLNRVVSVNAVTDADTFNYVPPDRPEVQATLAIVTQNPLTIRLNFPSKIGLIYRPEWRKIASGGTWAPLGALINGNGSTASSDTRTPTAGTEAYRVSVVNAIGPISINTDNPIDYPRKLHVSYSTGTEDVSWPMSVVTSPALTDGRPMYEYGVFRLRYVTSANRWEVWIQNQTTIPLYYFPDSRFVCDPSDLNDFQLLNIADGSVVGTVKTSPYFQKPNPQQTGKFLRSDGSWADLPAYLDDVREFDAFSTLPVPGETGVLYVTKDDNRAWRWVSSATGYVAVGGSNTGLDPAQFATHNSVEHQLRVSSTNTYVVSATANSFDMPAMFSPDSTHRFAIVEVPNTITSDFTLKLPPRPMKLDGTYGGKLVLELRRVGQPGATPLRKITIVAEIPVGSTFSTVPVYTVPFGGTAFSGAETRQIRFWTDEKSNNRWNLDMSPSGLHPFDGAVFWSGENSWKKPTITSAGDWAGGSGPYGDRRAIAYSSTGTGFELQNAAMLSYSDAITPLPGWPSDSLREKFRQSSRSKLSFRQQANLAGGDQGTLETETLNKISKTDGTQTILKLPYHTAQTEAGKVVGDRIIAYWPKYLNGDINGSVQFQGSLDGFYGNMENGLLLAGQYIVFESVEYATGSRYWHTIERGWYNEPSTYDLQAEQRLSLREIDIVFESPSTIQLDSTHVNKVIKFNCVTPINNYDVILPPTEQANHGDRIIFQDLVYETQNIQYLTIKSPGGTPLATLIAGSKFEFVLLGPSLTSAGRVWRLVNDQFRGATPTVNGKAGWVPPALAGEQNKFLKGDGTWGSAPSAGASPGFVIAMSTVL